MKNFVILTKTSNGLKGFEVKQGLCKFASGLKPSELVEFYKLYSFEFEGFEVLFGDVEFNDLELGNVCLISQEGYKSIKKDKYLISQIETSISLSIMDRYIKPQEDFRELVKSKFIANYEKFKPILSEFEKLGQYAKAEEHLIIDGLHCTLKKFSGDVNIWHIQVRDSEFEFNAQSSFLQIGKFDCQSVKLYNWQGVKNDKFILN